MRRLASFAWLLALAVPALAQSRCPLVPFGPTCGAKLSGSVVLDGQNRVVTCSLDNAARYAFGFTVLGSRTASFRLPGPGCDLLVEPELAVPFVTDGAGHAQQLFTAPYPIVVLAYAQGVVFLRNPVGLVEFHSSNGLRIGPWFGVHSSEETFDTTASLDAVRSGAQWGGGLVRGGKLGGSGILGDFHASDGKDLKLKDAQGRDIYEWNTDSMEIPATRTLTGKTITVSNGTFEFLSFVVGPQEHVRIVGTRAPRIEVAGEVRIEGAVELMVPKPPLKDTDARRGIAGGAGGLGGASGGRGGDKPNTPNGQVAGRNGGDAVIPNGHPRAGQELGSGGLGTLAHPASGLDKDVIWIIDSGYKVYSRMVAAGGAGGSLFDAGTPGIAQRTINPHPWWPYAPNNAEFGPSSAPGKVFPVLPDAPTLSSSVVFLLGGAGGGGGGAQPLYSTSGVVSWSPGAGGGGGGGTLWLRAGADLTVASAALLLARGGDANQLSLNNNQPPVNSAGGGGSGGSILAQCAGKASILGEVNVRGGKGGLLYEKLLVHVESRGGDGGSGFVRIEALPVPDYTTFTRLQPPAIPENAGLLRPIDHGQVTAATSKWIDTGYLPAVWQYYEIHARVDGVPIVYSDNPRVAARPAGPGEAVVFHVQSAMVDTQGQVIGEPTPWAQAAIDPLNDSANRGNSFRFVLRVDRGKATTGAVEIDSVKVFFDC